MARTYRPNPAFKMSGVRLPVAPPKKARWLNELAGFFLSCRAAFMRSGEREGAKGCRGGREHAVGFPRGVDRSQGARSAVFPSRPGDAETHRPRQRHAGSRVRARVEHVFAEQKARMGPFIRTIGIGRAAARSCDHAASPETRSRRRPLTKHVSGGVQVVNAILNLPHCPSPPPQPRRRKRWILPVAVLGRVSTKWNQRGYL
jgi:hypothetical protein